MRDRDTLSILAIVALVGALAYSTGNLDTPLLITLWVAEVPIGVFLHIVTKEKRQTQEVAQPIPTHPPPSIEDQQWLAKTSPRIFDFLKTIPMGIGSQQYKIYLAQLELLLRAEPKKWGMPSEEYLSESTQVEMIARAFLLSRWRKD